MVAKKALEAGITTVVFDRGGFLFHGRVKALADAAREAGLKFQEVFFVSDQVKEMTQNMTATTEERQYEERVVVINRVTKVVKGGRTLRF